jgi:hypothetical protein
MADLLQLEARMKALDQQISPIANQTVDIAALMKRKKEGNAPVFSALEQAGVKSEAEALIEDLIAAYRSGNDAARDHIRAMLSGHESFDWAVGFPPVVPDPAENFRRQLLRLSMSDQGRDARDLMMALEGRHREALAAGVNLAPIAEEIAALSSDKDRYGMGSTKQIFLNVAQRWEGASKKT